jgi:hypothetical protein
MSDPAKHTSLYSYGWDEQPDPFADRQIASHGKYLCVQWSDHPLHVYRQIEPGAQVHPAVDQIEYQGQSYYLDWIDDEKEHATRL